MRRVLAQHKAKKKKAAPSELPPAKIVLLLPDLTEMYLDLTDAEGVEVKLRRLADKPA
jgi:hypothetical protein